MSVEIIATLEQKNNQDFPIVDCNDILGGIYQVSTIADRDNIPECRRKLGMLVCVTDDTYKIYQLRSNIDNSGWIEYITTPQQHFTGQSIDTTLTGPQVISKLVTNEYGSVTETAIRNINTEDIHAAKDTGILGNKFQLNLSNGPILKNNNGNLDVRNSDDSDYASLTIKDLTVKGTTTTINSETVTVSDNIIVLNSTHEGLPTLNGGIEIKRGTEVNASLIWDETNDCWKCGLLGDEDEIVLLSKSQTLSNKIFNDTQFNGNTILTTLTINGETIANGPVTLNAPLTTNAPLIANSILQLNDTILSSADLHIQNNKNIYFEGDMGQGGSLYFNTNGSIYGAGEIHSIDNCYFGKNIYVTNKIYCEGGYWGDDGFYPKGGRWTPEGEIDCSILKTGDIYGNDTWLNNITCAGITCEEGELTFPTGTITTFNSDIIKCTSITSSTLTVDSIICPSLAGNATSSDSLSTPRKISLNGGVVGYNNFDGSSDITINTVVTDNSHYHSDSTLNSISWSKILNIPSPNITLTGGATGIGVLSTLNNAVIDVTIADNSHSHDNSTISSLDWTKILNKPDPTITLLGDVTGSAIMMDLNNVSITTHIEPDSHDHSHLSGTDAVSFQLFRIGSGPLLKANNGNLDIRNYSDTDYANITAKNLIVEGSDTTIKSENVKIYDNIITLNSNSSSIPSENGGMEIYRGEVNPTASLIWNETLDWWTMGTSGSEVSIVDISTPQILTNKTITGIFHGNSDTTTKLETGRIISLSNDVDGSVYFDGTSDIDISVTVHDDSHNHTNLTGTTSVTYQINGPKIKNNSGVLEFRNAQDSDYCDISCNNLTVRGTTTTINSETVTISDNILTLNSNMDTGSPSENAGLEIKRGDLSSASLIWDESTDWWKIGIVGSEIPIVDTTTPQTLTNKTITGSFTGNVTGNSSSATRLETTRNIIISGDANGSATFNGTADANINITILDDSHSHSNSTLSSIDWSKVLNKPSPILTLTGDVSGTAIFTTLNSVSLNTVVADNSHSHDTSTLSSIDWTKIINKPTAIQRINNLTSSYGCIDISSSTNGWAGIHFPDAAGTLMINNATQGFYTDSGAWSWNISNGVFSGTATTAKYADVAEKYTCANKEIPVGTLMSVSTDYEYEVCESNDKMSKIIGVISDSPAYLMNEACDGVIVGLLGKVPVRVNGFVYKGDMLCLDSNGVAKVVDKNVITDIMFSFATSLETIEDINEKLVLCILK